MLFRSTVAGPWNTCLTVISTSAAPPAGSLPHTIQWGMASATKPTAQHDAPGRTCGPKIHRRKIDFRNSSPRHEARRAWIVPDATLLPPQPSLARPRARPAACAAANACARCGHFPRTLIMVPVPNSLVSACIRSLSASPARTVTPGSSLRSRALSTEAHPGRDKRTHLREGAFSFLPR
mgnify:CR=1 FL=1